MCPRDNLVETWHNKPRKEEDRQRFNLVLLTGPETVTWRFFCVSFILYTMEAFDRRKVPKNYRRYNNSPLKVHMKIDLSGI